MTEPLRVDLVDISHHNTVTDLNAARRAGVHGVYHKVSEGATFLDSKFVQRRELCKLKNMPFGGYHFARPEGADATAEANFFLKNLKFTPGDLVPMLDLEDMGGLSKTQLTNWVHTWMGIVKSKLRVQPVLYTNFDLLSDFNAALWVARYNNSNTPPVTPEPWSRWDIWQFSNGVYGVPNRIQGFSGAIDLNHFTEGFTIKNLLSKTGGPKPDTKTASGEFRITSQNVKKNLKYNNILEDIQITAAQSGIIGWQEMETRDHRTALRKLDANKWQTVFADSSAPISYRRKYWKFVKSGTWRLHPGTVAVTPARPYNWVLLNLRGLDVDVLVTNKHFVSGAFNQKINEPFEAKRDELWKQGIESEKAFLKPYIEQGVPIVCLGDYNRQLRFKPTPFGDTLGGRHVIYATEPRAIDYVILIPGSTWKWQLLDKEALPGRNSDHSGRRAVVKLAKNLV